ncbi:MAG: hypothetical protein SFW67_01500 [Myxococcaceae bacterium]|nr:hypothetical protein [Myxococcaceae bacterium]
MKTSLRAGLRRGAATVELAVSMIFLVPLIMYMVTLQEMFIMKFNGQEGAIQASWDFTVLDYSQAPPMDSGEQGFNGGSVGSMSRLTYCDHSAAYDSYDQPRDCDDQVHHKNMTVHECWIGDSPGSYGGQISCYSAGEPLRPTGAASGAVAQQFGNGGVVNCTSRLGIMNYYLPNSFLNNFRKGKGFDVNTDASGQNKEKMKSRWAFGNDASKQAAGNQDQAHNDKDQATPAGDKSLGSNYWRLARTNHQMLTDPWAVGLVNGGNVQGINPNVPSAFNSGGIYGRIRVAYGTAGQAIRSAERWNQDIQQAGFLNGNSRQDARGDNLDTAAAAFRPNSAEQEFNNHWAAQWSDQRVRSAHGSRGSAYFGLQQ